MGAAGRAWGAAIVALAAVSCGERDGTSPFPLDPDGGADATTIDDASAPDDAAGALSADGAPIDATQAGGPSLRDGAPDVTSDACVRGDAGPPPLRRRCAPATLDECDGATDSWLASAGVAPALANGPEGNGFDDDCDGLVDEGCPCGATGGTKRCYLVPATQADPATGAPVGWCAENAKGSLACVGTEFPAWSGACRGAQPPYAHDACAPGDFDCDGVDEDSDVEDCACHAAPVTCPTAPIVEPPYPDPKAIPRIDGTAWIAGGAAKVTGWRWTVIGGDCDDILPHPTFALYASADSTAPAARIGARTPVKLDATLHPPEYVAASGAPTIAIDARTGDGAAGGVVYPAFALSGDYVVQGAFDLDGRHYVCTQKVAVRAPGIRAELCWDTVGDAAHQANGGANDLDLHLARLQGTDCAGSHGWDTTCASTTTGFDDCWWNGVGGCRDFSGAGPRWGYADSSDAACIGWGSRRHPKDGATYLQGCTNPRLDRDNITCDPAVDDPNAPPPDDEGHGGFCGPENVNLDAPNDGDRFVVGVNHFENHGGASQARAHVNVYCDGARVLAAGYDPAVSGNPPHPSAFPVLSNGGEDLDGDLWSVATITWRAADGGEPACDVATVPSKSPDPARDGPNDTQLCVDSAQPGAPHPYTTHRFVDATGALPTSAAGFCKH